MGALTEVTQALTHPFPRLERETLPVLRVSSRLLAAMVTQAHRPLNYTFKGLEALNGSFMPGQGKMVPAGSQA